MFSWPPDTTSHLSTLPGHYLTTADNGEVYLEATELELGRSRSLYVILERFQRRTIYLQSCRTLWTQYRHCLATAWPLTTTEKSTSTPQNWNLVEVGRHIWHQRDKSCCLKIESCYMGSVLWYCIGNRWNLSETLWNSQIPPSSSSPASR